MELVFFPLVEVTATIFQLCVTGLQYSPPQLTRVKREDLHYPSIYISVLALVKHTVPKDGEGEGGKGKKEGEKKGGRGEGEGRRKGGSLEVLNYDKAWYRWEQETRKKNAM